MQRFQQRVIFAGGRGVSSQGRQRRKRKVQRQEQEKIWADGQGPSFDARQRLVQLRKMQRQL